MKEDEKKKNSAAQEFVDYYERITPPEQRNKVGLQNFKILILGEKTNASQSLHPEKNEED